MIPRARPERARRSAGPRNADPRLYRGPPNPSRDYFFISSNDPTFGSSPTSGRA
jgi:hypothetical protein